MNEQTTPSETNELQDQDYPTAHDDLVNTAFNNAASSNETQVSGTVTQADVDPENVLDLSNKKDVDVIEESLAKKATDLPPTIALVFDTFDDLNDFKSRSNNSEAEIGIFGTDNVKAAIQNYNQSFEPVDDANFTPEEYKSDEKSLTIREQLKSIEQSADGTLRLVIGRWLRELAEFGH